jgi:hypothetical protein
MAGWALARVASNAVGTGTFVLARSCLAVIDVLFAINACKTVRPLGAARIAVRSVLAIPAEHSNVTITDIAGDGIGAGTTYTGRGRTRVDINRAVVA